MHSGMMGTDELLGELGIGVKPYEFQKLLTPEQITEHLKKVGKKFACPFVDLPVRRILIGVSPNSNQWFVNFADDEVRQILDRVWGPDLNAELCIIRRDNDVSDWMRAEQAGHVMDVNPKFGYLHPMQFDAQISASIASINHPPDQGRARYTLNTYRHLKHNQARMFGKTIQHLGLKTALNLETHSIAALSKYMDKACLDKHSDGVWVMRPNLGARSIGMVIYDSNVTPTYDIVRKIDKEWFNAQPDLPPGVVINNGTERGDYEGWHALKASPFIQKYNTDAVGELRLILDGFGTYSVVLSRSKSKISGGDYYVADSNNDVVLGQNLNTEGMQRLLEATFDVTRPEMAAEMSAAFKHMQLQYCSIDFFINKDGRWGFYEFSNEFTCNDWPREVLIDTMIEWYVQLLSAAFKTK